MGCFLPFHCSEMQNTSMIKKCFTQGNLLKRWLKSLLDLKLSSTAFMCFPSFLCFEVYLLKSEIEE